MARYTYESITAWWVTTLGSTTSPSAAQINAGQNLTTFTPVDGVTIGGTRNNASQAMLGGAFVTEEPGTWGTTVEFTFVRDDTADTIWELFAGNYKVAGFIVIRRTGTGNAASTQKFEIYPARAHEPQMLQSAENEYAKFTVTFAVTSTPSLEAVAVA